MLRSALHRLEQQQVVRDMLADKVECEQRMPQMVQHAHEDHEVEPLPDRAHIVDVELGELDIVIAERFAREPGLREIALVAVDAEHARRAAALHLDRIEAGVAADVEHALARKILRQMRREAAEFRAWIIAEEMVGRGPHAAEVRCCGTTGRALRSAPQDRFAEPSAAGFLLPFIRGSVRA